MPKEKLAALTTIMMPISMAAQAYVSKWTVGASAKPLELWLLAYKGRLLVGGLLVGLVHAIGGASGGGGGPLPAWIYALGLVASGSSAVVSSVMFVSQMAFFNGVSDPKIGGTYMTMLNTLSNLGGQWPGTVVLQTKAALEPMPFGPGVDPFTVVTSGSLVLGVAWLALMSGRVRKLQAMPLASWHTS